LMHCAHKMLIGKISELYSPELQQPKVMTF